MKKSILLIAVLLVGMAARAQYFNVRDPLHSFAAGLSSVLPYHDKYYCAGIAWDSINYAGNGTAWHYEGIKFAVYDLSGSKLRDTIYQRNDLPYINPGIATLQLLDSNHFIAGISTDDTTGTTGIDRTGIVILDTLGNVLWQNLYNRPCSYNWFQFADLKPDGYGHWLMLGNVVCSPQTKDNDFLLMKLDSNFNVLWTKEYGTAINEMPMKLLIEPNGYIMAGWRDNVGIKPKNFYAQALLIKTDTSGNQLWEYTGHSGVLTGPANDVIRTQDGGYVYCGTGSGYEYLSANGSSSQIMWRGWVEKIDSNRHVLWNKTIGPMNTNAGSNDQNVLKELATGDILIAGSIIDPIWWTGTDTAGIANGSFTKMDANGNILWQRKYKTPQTDTFFYYSVYDMKSAPDGGFVMVGQAYDYRNIYGNPTQRGWIIKVDSNGCSGPDDPQCWPLAVANTVKNNQAISVYPNPVTDILQINNPLSNAMLLQLTDITGKMLLQQTVLKGHAEISLQSFSPGMYLYRFTDGKGYVQQGKLVKQ